MSQSNLWLLMLAILAIAAIVLAVGWHLRDRKRCKHCGKLPEADGDHSCTCPFADDVCHHTRNT